ncbi:MAG: hypothetical protein RI981_386 [Bacteroidota bacterium]|jgi:hypothetical protein
MLTSLTQNWGFMRIIRLFIGGYALVEAIRTSDVLIGIMGTVLLGMALFNLGCGAQGCGVPTSRTKNTHSDDIEYEEIHSK